jgi:transcription elongation factor GreA-like protein
MTIKAGNFVSHACALEWGAGKVLEVTAAMATIQFSDGKNRKIAASHFTTLQPAAASSFTPPPDPAPVVKAIRAPRTVKKKK